MSSLKWVIGISVGALLLISLAEAQNANQGQSGQPAQQAQPGQPPGPGGGPGGPGGPGGGPPNFEQMRERMMNDIKDQLGSADDEWKVLRPKIEKVQTVQFQSFTMPQMGFGRRPGGGPQGGPGGGPGGGQQGGPGARPQGGPGGGPQGGPGGFGGFPESKLAQAQRELGDTLQDKNAPSADITRKLTAYRELRDKGRAELLAARKELKELVTPRQEAVLVLRGILE